MVRQKLDRRDGGWWLALALSLISVMGGLGVALLIGWVGGHFGFGGRGWMALQAGLFFMPNAGFAAAFWIFEHALGVSVWTLIHGDLTGVLALGFVFNIGWWRALLQVWRVLRFRW